MDVFRFAAKRDLSMFMLERKKTNLPFPFGNSTPYALLHVYPEFWELWEMCGRRNGVLEYRLLGFSFLRGEGEGSKCCASRVERLILGKRWVRVSKFLLSWQSFIYNDLFLFLLNVLKFTNNMYV